MNNTMLVWTGDDYEHHKCRADQIGTPKTVQDVQEVQDIQDVLNALPPLDMAELRQSALRVARGTMGYDKFFKTYPSFLHKFLLVMAKESTPPPQPRPMQPMPEVPWITSQRLSYKRDAEQQDAKEVVRSATRIEHRPTEDD